MSDEELKNRVEELENRLGVIEDVHAALTGMLEPEYEDVVQGRAIVRQVFSIPRLGKIAGSQVREVQCG